MTPAIRWPAFDGLRALAALVVLSIHVGLPTPGGFLGVDVFFVLSGFLITTLLRREQAATGTIRVGRFWARRMWRLYPGLAAMAVPVCLLAIISGRHSSAVVLGGVATLGYVANIWIRFHATYLFQHTWTLAIEQQFYLVWPVLFGLTSRRSGRIILVVCAVATVPVFALSGHQVLVTYLRGTGLALGCALAWLIEVPSIRATARWLGWPAMVGLGCAVMGVIPEGPLAEWWVPLGSILAVPVVAAATQSTSLARALAVQPLRWLGVRSYSLYLWHFPIAAIALDNAPGSFPHWLRVLIAIVTSLVAADLSYRFVERPALAWRARVRRLDSVAEPVG